MTATPADVPAKLVVRPFAAPDREPAIALLDSDPWRRLGYGRDDWLRLLTTPLDGREGWVATTPNDVVGLALVRPRFLAGDYLELFAVAEAARGKRCGATLLAHLEAVTFARGRNLFVCVSTSMGGAAVLRPPGTTTSARCPTCWSRAARSCCCGRPQDRSLSQAPRPTRRSLSAHSAAARASSVPCPRGVRT